MLKTIILIFSVFTFFQYFRAQSHNAEFPSSGTNYIFAKTKLFPEKKINIRGLGTDTWDISAFLPQEFDTIRFKEPLKTRYGRRFPEANIAMATSPVKIEYLTLDSGKIFLTGLIDDFMEKNLPLLLRFSDKLLYKDPYLALNQEFSDTSETNFLSPYYIHPATDSIRADIRYIRTGRKDATGVLITPLGKFEAEREVIFVEKVVKGYKYSVFGWTPAPEYSLNKHYTYYRWFTKDSKLPIAEAYLNDEDYIEYIRYQYDSPLRLNFTGNHVTCKGGSDGMVELNIIGGIPDYTCLWSTGDSTNILSNVKAGTYNVEVTDNRGRKISTFYTVAEPLYELNGSFEINHVSCKGLKDGKVSLKIEGGTGPYDFRWSNDSANEILQNLPPGWLSVWISDSRGCRIKDSIEIKEPHEKVSVSSEEKNVSCFRGIDGTALLTGHGGTAPYTFKWSDGDTSRYRTGLKAGQYLVNVYDKNQCHYKSIITIKEPDSPLKISKNIKPVNCFGGSDGSISLTASGGKAPYHFIWSDSSESKALHGLSSRNYFFKLTDNNGCSIADSAFVQQPASPLSFEAIKKDVSCYGENSGEIKITVQGGSPEYAFLWSNGSNKQNIDKLPEGNYILKVKDKNQCTLSDTIEILAPEKTLAAEIIKTDVKCKNGNDGTLQVIPAGGTPEYTFQWSNKSNEKNQTGLKAGNYELMLTDKNNCRLKKEININQPDEVLVIKPKKTDVDCFGAKSGAIFLEVTGGIPAYDYLWSDGSTVPNLLGLNAGKYSANITDNAGCQKTIIVEILEPEKITVIPAITNPDKDKDNGAISIEIKGGTNPYQILWDNGQNTPFIQNLVKGSYEIQVTDSKECRISQVVDLDEK